MRKTVLASAVAVLVSATTVACGSGESMKPLPGRSKGPIAVTVVSGSATGALLGLMEQGARCAVQRDPEVSLRWVPLPPPADVPHQAAVVRDELARGTDALVYAPLDPDGMARTSVEITKAGVALANFEAGTEPRPSDVPVFGTDDFVAARRAGEFITGRLLGTGQVAVLQADPVRPVTAQRMAGFTAEMLRNPGIRLVGDRGGLPDHAAAVAAAERVLADNPGLNALFAVDEVGTAGAAEAIRRTGRGGAVTVVGWDDTGRQAAEVRTGVLDGVVVANPFRMTFEAVSAVIARLRRGDQRPSVDTGTILVTDQNLRRPEVATLLAPSCSTPPPGVPSVP
ncbi:sugar ABC transporter substrate-binding protein [Amycolatopsis suaedae]|uniref:Periplasmic binding protein domain-containing protein n=1 Tax=Amycolatopsis suaedae TaxID=2510978 RepID=A0A4Q7J0N6_9PSEU|nr:substrate-binding domain-containing protein [Amycolatopsis suaedae]RZQ60288.1 hypothetical protein EWH70_30355 [Amycolatopsis suaedae]